MKVTEQQLLMLMQINVDSLVIAGNQVFVYSQATRRQLAESLLNQQTGELEAKPDSIAGDCSKAKGV